MEWQDGQEGARRSARMDHVWSAAIHTARQRQRLGTLARRGVQAVVGLENPRSRRLSGQWLPPSMGLTVNPGQSGFALPLASGTFPSVDHEGWKIRADPEGSRNEAGLWFRFQVVLAGSSGDGFSAWFLKPSEHRRRPGRLEFMAAGAADLVRTKLEFSLVVQLLRIPTLREEK